MSHANLLVVEDDEALRSLLITYFKERSDIDVDVARDGAEALHRISQKQYNAVLLDLMMPHMSGIDFLDSLNALTSDPSLNVLAVPPRVLVMTSVSQEDFPSCDIASRCPDLVRGVLRKPVDLCELGACVDRLL
jgi:DNA-binding response OmpR family regulator